EDDERIRVDGHGDRGRDPIAVDVEGLLLRRQRERRDHRDPPRTDELREERQVHRFDLSRVIVAQQAGLPVADRARILLARDEVGDRIAFDAGASARLHDRAQRHGCSPTKPRPASSAYPHETFIAWTPLPAAPFMRLSIAQSATTRSPRGSRANPTSAKFVPARSFGSGYRQMPVRSFTMRTNGSAA